MRVSSSIGPAIAAPQRSASDWLPSLAIRSKNAVFAEIASVVAARLPHAKAAASIPNGSRSKRSSAWMTNTSGTPQTISRVIANSDDDGAAETRPAMMPPAPSAPIATRKANSQNAGSLGRRILPRSCQLGPGADAGRLIRRRLPSRRSRSSPACRRRRRGTPPAGSRRSPRPARRCARRPRNSPARSSWRSR